MGISDFPKAGQDLLVVPNEDAAKGVIEGRTRRDVFRVCMIGDAVVVEVVALALQSFAAWAREAGKASLLLSSRP